jgi:hypothetical protein
MKESIVRTFEDNRRSPEADWFELIGAYGMDDAKLVRLGGATNGIEITAMETAPFWLFTNDLMYKYGNNKGAIDVTITRAG